MIGYLGGSVIKWFEFILQKYLKDKENDKEITYIFKNFNYFIIKFKDIFNNLNKKRVIKR